MPVGNHTGNILLNKLEQSDDHPFQDFGCGVLHGILHELQGVYTKIGKRGKGTAGPDNLVLYTELAEIVITVLKKWKFDFYLLNTDVSNTHVYHDNNNYFTIGRIFNYYAFGGNMKKIWRQNWDELLDDKTRKMVIKQTRKTMKNASEELQTLYASVAQNGVGTDYAENRDNEAALAEHGME